MNISAKIQVTGYSLGSRRPSTVIFPNEDFLKNAENPRKRLYFVLMESTAECMTRDFISPSRFCDIPQFGVDSHVGPRGPQRGEKVCPPWGRMKANFGFLKMRFSPGFRASIHSHETLKFPIFSTVLGSSSGEI